MKKTVNKTVLNNWIRHTDSQNRVWEESEMWKQRKLEEDVKKDRENNTTRDEKRKKELPPVSEYKSGYWNSKLMALKEADSTKWGHSGYKELYPEEFDSSVIKDSPDKKQKKSKRHKDSPREDSCKRSHERSRKRSNDQKSSKEDKDLTGADKKGGHQKKKKSKHKAAENDSDSSASPSRKSRKSKKNKTSTHRKRKLSDAVDIEVSKLNKNDKKPHDDTRSENKLSAKGTKDEKPIKKEQDIKPPSKSSKRVKYDKGMSDSTYDYGHIDKNAILRQRISELEKGEKKVYAPSLPQHHDKNNSEDSKKEVKRDTSNEKRVSKKSKKEDEHGSSKKNKKKKKKHKKKDKHDYKSHDTDDTRKDKNDARTHDNEHANKEAQDENGRDISNEMSPSKKFRFKESSKTATKESTSSPAKDHVSETKTSHALDDIRDPVLDFPKSDEEFSSPSASDDNVVALDEGPHGQSCDKSKKKKKDKKSKRKKKKRKKDSKKGAEEGLNLEVSNNFGLCDSFMEFDEIGVL